MKCELKTLKGATFSVEVEPDTSVAKVKELAAASEPGVKDGWEVGNIKLIHQGKVALFHGDGDLVSAASPLQMLPSLARSLFSLFRRSSLNCCLRASQARVIAWT